MKMRLPNEIEIFTVKSDLSKHAEKSSSKHKTNPVAIYTVNTLPDLFH